MSRTKNKPPAFLCYADDALSGMLEMTCEESGAYWKMLLHSWNRHGLDDDVDRLANLIGRCHGDPKALVTEVLRLKFFKDTDGRWRNARQEEVRAKQNTFSEKQSSNATAGWEKKRRAEVTPPPPPDPPLPEANIPTLKDVLAMAAMQNITPEIATAFYNHYNRLNLWQNQYGRMIKVRECLQSWSEKEKKFKNYEQQASRTPRPEGAPTAKEVAEYAAEKWGDDHRHLNWAVSFHSWWRDKKRNWQRNGKVIDWRVEFSAQVSKWRSEPKK